MTSRLPLVVVGGQIQQLQSGDTLSANASGALAQSNNLSDVASVGLAWANLQQAPSNPSGSTSLLASAAGQDQNATGTSTLTVPNGGAGWRTGTIKNANTVTGFVTLAVPSGATLTGDGVSSNALVLYPYQKARLIQTGATAYTAEWIDRSPLIVDGSRDGAVTTGVASADYNLPVGYTTFLAVITSVYLSTTAYFGVRLSDSGASGIKAGGSDYVTTRQISGASGGTNNANGTSAAQAFTDSYGYLMVSGTSNSVTRGQTSFVLWPGATNQYPNLLGSSFFVDSSPYRTVSTQAIDFTGATSGPMGRANLLRIVTSTGTVTFNVSIWGRS